MTAEARLVLDASVFVATCFPHESQHERAKALVAKHRIGQPFVVPDVFRLEVVAAHARRRIPEHEIDIVAARIDTDAFEYHDVTPDLVQRAVTVARNARLRAYDALYVALALQENARLATLDDEVRAGIQRCYAGLLVD